MTEKIQKRLLDLKAAQDADTPMRCPRCGADTMKSPMHTNALSRHQDLYICDSCGTAEALLDFMGQTYPLYQWQAFAPQKPPFGFQSTHSLRCADGDPADPDGDPQPHLHSLP